MQDSLLMAHRSLSRALVICLVVACVPTQHQQMRTNDCAEGGAWQLGDTGARLTFTSKFPLQSPFPACKGSNTKQT